MVDDRYEFKPSLAEQEHLMRLRSHPDAPASLGYLRGDNATIVLTRTEAEELREFFTTRLAQVGFDESYQPNAIGRVLEDLIDRFFLP